MTRTRFQFISSCLNPHGTRAVQKLFEYITTQQQIFMVLSALNSGAVALATDLNGHHVIQHCLIRFSNEDNKASSVPLGSMSIFSYELILTDEIECNLNL
ncbi:hypothetical protein Acr_00g0089060 [Actinidia rufa]|uniref:PUM-HD domain-containing protein n=1 Tax=Actinidia rufa TaxID=165716 RepID=A0A7J0DWN7_9ERIC|nr:hypothetical protein Acr_00g0089060 [Actinidia rufa]